MTTYKVTTELKTYWWWKVLRFFRLKNKREEFEMIFDANWFNKGEILSYEILGSIKILNKQ